MKKKKNLEKVLIGTGMSSFHIGRSAMLRRQCYLQPLQNHICFFNLSNLVFLTIYYLSVIILGSPSAGLRGSGVREGAGCHIETSGLHKPHFESNIVKVVNDLGECISEETVPQAEGKVNTKPLRWDVVWGNVAGANQWEGA